MQLGLDSGIRIPGSFWLQVRPKHSHNFSTLQKESNSIIQLLTLDRIACADHAVFGVRFVGDTCFALPHASSVSA